MTPVSNQTVKKIFGTDGVRGQVGEPPITPETVLKLGWAAGRVLGGELGGKIVIGKDTRVSGYLLESALEAGLSAAGMDISLIGPMPTPGISYLTRTARATAGIVISASHNPYHDNGIKFFSPDGSKLRDHIELEIEKLMRGPIQTVVANRLGKAERFPDAPGRYIEYCKSSVSPNLSLRGLKIVLDCANGASYHVAPPVFEELGADVIAIGVDPDGFNINSDCGSTNPKHLQHMVRKTQADLGIALDGDGDRVVMVDERSQLVDGDQILYIMSQARIRNGNMSGGIVGTAMTNSGLELACKEQNIPFDRSAVGDRHVYQLLKQNNWLLGGETSGHILCLEKSTTGDGIIAALDVLESLVERSSTLSSLTSGMERFPQSIVNVSVPRNSAFINNSINNSVVQEAVRDTQRILGDGGRVILRPSGTESVIRVMVEGRDQSLVSSLSADLAKLIANTQSVP